MTPDQWFTLWITLAQIVAGGIVALIAVWVGAGAALRTHRAASRHDRVLGAMEDVLAALDNARLALAQVSIGHCDVVNEVLRVQDELIASDIGHKAWLLPDRETQLGVARAVQRVVDLHLRSFDEATQVEADAGVLATDIDRTCERLRAAVLGKREEDVTPADRDLIRQLVAIPHARRRTEEE